MLKKFLYWSPRILSIIFIIFLSLFALDTFNEYQGLAALFPLLIHLLIPIILLIGILMAWKWDLIGVLIFFAFAFYYIWLVGLGRHWSWYISIVGPAIIIGGLFLLNWLQKRKGNKI